VIRNLKSKLKAMSSSSPSLNHGQGSAASPPNEPGSSLEDGIRINGAFDYVEVNRSREKNNTDDSDNKHHVKAHTADNKIHTSLENHIKARGDFGGQIVEEADGFFVRKRTIYEINTSYGKINLSGLMTSEFPNSRWWTRLNQNLHSRDIVFLDTETTGLAGGTGTYAFLIGLGYVTDQGLVIEQYLMRDFDEEYPMLHSVMKTLKKFRVLITFNGKSFDWPLLESRLVYSRLGTITWEDAHLDLLHTSRRLWGQRLESCSLSSIEKSILSHVREDDIPGSQIPGIYFDYLENRNPDMMKRVIQHNEWDIAAMAALLLHVNSLYQDPMGRGDAYELLGAAKELERNYKIQEAAACYQRCIQISQKHSLTVEAKKRLAYLKKRYEGPEEAMDIWIDLIKEEGNLLIFPLIEMAKYLEHGKKDFQKALKCTDRAILLADARSGNSSKLREELFARRRRLIRKLERSLRNGVEGFEGGQFSIS
jgi:uncharacterized protein YprB with RNaseH-like and TPR domain